ncbi:3ac5b8bc-e163-42ed-b5f3-d5c09abd00fd-CDS [Sclerotinia trifoliorum]|uniref:3ac5b8bc-e163-42ed-b5f3-d5c09abd00fd-CDS n=1 Tax=Sclerotinia trifoliorum TaxID=28548 RepID=A0A8H2VRH4_9HELO|nr:3ac5b8bc-e163-42ed-b5f3-d5c09abd00fd-CDS [Sclerotinia trifoliorum]
MSENTNMATLTSFTAVKADAECCIKNFYRMNEACGQYTWKDNISDDLKEAIENGMPARYAILVYNRKTFDSRMTFEIERYHLSKSVSQERFEQDFEGLSLRHSMSKRIVFQESCHDFAHRWTELGYIYDPNRHYHQITDAEFEKLADANIIGRRIQNVLKTAKLLASCKNQLLEFEHVQTVISVGRN